MTDADDDEGRPGRATSSSGPSTPLGHLTRSEAARYVGVSRSEFKRREAKGLYVPSEIDERGYRLYSREYLDEARARVRPQPGRRRVPGTVVVQAVGSSSTSATTVRRGYSPEDADRVFDELERDEDLVRVVRGTKLHPDVVLQIHSDWMRLRRVGGGLHVSGEVLRRLNRLPLEGFPCESPEELASALEAVADSASPCRRCRRRPPRTIVHCAQCESQLASERAAAP